MAGIELSTEEKQEIIRHVEAGKPLPDKYRFLLFDDKREVELVWNGKNRDIAQVALPFQTIEHVDEPRAESKSGGGGQLGFSFDEAGRQSGGWTNKLIWGDNKLILSSLKSGPMRRQIDEAGGLKLIYIDPPFDVGADFSMDIEVGGETLTKEPNILEQIAYRDTWGKGADSFIQMIYERLILMRDLLADDGSIYVHCDWRVSGYLRLALDDVFGSKQMRNEIAWCYVGGRVPKVAYGRRHDTLFFYSKSEKWIFNWSDIMKPLDDDQIDRYKYEDEIGKYRLMGRCLNGSPIKAARDISPDWEKTNPELVYRYYMKEGTLCLDYWTDIPQLNQVARERTDYPTQKPSELIERIIKASSNEGDLVADFFCGSGTTAAVAEKLGRKWLVTDLGKFAIHTTRKRMIGVQRELQSADKPFRAFEVLNLGKYERQHFVAVNPNLRAKEKARQQQQKEKDFVDLILKAYRAERLDGFPAFHGKKLGRMVTVGPVNMPVTRLFVEEIIVECRKKRVSKVDLLGFEFEMGLFPNVLEEARSKGIEIAPKHIPAEVFDKRAVKRGQVVFHDVSAIEARPHIGKNKDGETELAVELTDFCVFYSQDTLANAEASLGNGKHKLIVERGQVMKVLKDKHGIFTREPLTKHWTDWIDYWAVDFNFESKRELITKQNEETGEWTERWTGDYVFENEWQSFRTKRDRTLEMISVKRICEPGPRKVAVKVIDIFGNDTMTIMSVNI